MHKTLRAPELSATSNMLSACTIARSVSPAPCVTARAQASDLRPLQDLTEPPALVAAERPRLGDQHAVADLTLVAFVVDLVARAPRQELLVLRVLHTAIDGHD